MIKLFDASGSGYIEAEVKDFYCNDFPIYFAKAGKDSYLRDFQPFYTVPIINNGSTPVDNGNLIIEAADYDEFIAREPKAKKYIRPFKGSREFIHKLPRYCLWLVDCPPNELKKMPLVYKRVQAVRDFRLKSPKAATRKNADTSWLFQEIRQPKTDYILIPLLSSERRKYIPMDFMDSNTIVSNLAFSIPNAMYFHFGVLTSLPHMAWMRAICGRLKSDYRYSASIIYNNFAWPPFYREIERTAAQILAVREKYPDASFADLYDPLIMPKELRRAHELNDKAVMEAYDFPKNITEQQMVNFFMKMYKNLLNLREIFYGK